MPGPPFPPISMDARTSQLAVLQRAIIARLREHTSTSAWPVYDDVPPDAPLPYITYGDDTEVDASYKIAYGSDITITLNAWSDYRGWKQIKTMISGMLQALDMKDWDIPTECGVTLADIDMIRTLRGDGKLRQGIVRLKFRTYQDNYLH